MTEQRTPSKWWQFEQRVKVAWKNRKDETIKDAVSDGNKLGAFAIVASVGASVSSFIPILGTVFIAPPLALGTLVLGGLAARHYSRAAYNDKVDKVIDKKIEKWQQKPTPPVIVKTLGNILKYSVGTVRLGALAIATAGIATTAAASIMAFGSTALAGTSALSMATNTLAVASVAIGVVNPIGLLAAGVLAAGIGTITAIKGKKSVINLGKKLQKSAHLSKSGQNVSSNILGRFSNHISSSLKGLGADIFNIAAEKKAKEVKNKIQNAVQIPKIKNG